MSENWFTDELKKEAKEVFEAKYRKAFSDEEVILMCHRLLGFIELTINNERFKSNENNRFSV